MFISVPTSLLSSYYYSDKNQNKLVSFNSDYIVYIKIVMSEGRNEAFIFLDLAKSATSIEEGAVFVGGYRSKERAEEILNQMFEAMHKGEIVFRIPEA